MLILFPVCVLISTLICHTILKFNATNFSNFISGNFLLNSNFEEGFKNWSCDNGISLTNINGRAYVHTAASDGIKTRFYQQINVISGNVYRLKFDVKGKQNGAYCIYRDLKTNKEEYTWCKGENGEEKSYIWDIKPLRTGKNCIYFSANKQGDYYFTKISLSNLSNKSKLNFLFLFGAIFSLSIIIYVICFCILNLLKYTDILFALAIVIFILLPLTKINTETKSKNENRNLAQYKSLISNGKINKTYGKNFNSWINDRFLGRKFYLQANTLIKAFINNKIDNKQVLAGNDQWYFKKDNLSLLNSYNEDNPHNFSKLAKNISRLSNFCKSHNADLFILVLPCNEELYSEKLTGINLGKKKYAIAHTIDKLRNDTGVNIMYGSDSLEEAKQEGYACYKTDHHWTELGAFRSYQKIMKEIIKNHEDIVSLTDDDFDISDKPYTYSIGAGSIYSMLNLPDWTFDKFYPINTKYKSFAFKKKNNLEKKDELMLNKKGNNHFVFVFGDSMTIGIINFFWDSFAKTLLYKEYGYINMKNVETKIEEYNPDIAVMIVYYHNFERIKNWYNH